LARAADPQRALAARGRCEHVVQAGDRKRSSIHTASIQVRQDNPGIAAAAVKTSPA